MRTPKTSRTLRWILASAMVLSFALRAVVPQGFMPSADNPFVLQICPDGFPAHLLPKAQGHHAEHGMAAEDEASPGAPSKHHRYAAGEHCLFGAGASGAGPLSQIAISLQVVALHALPARETATPTLSSRRFTAAQPRAPPAFA